MQFLAVLSPNPEATPSEIAERAFAEEQQLWALYSGGQLRSMHFQADPVRGLLTFEAPDKTTVEEWLQRFPLVADRLFTFELIAAGPWTPLEALFNGAQAGSTGAGTEAISANARLVEALYVAIERDDHPAIHQLVSADLSWEVLKNYPEGGDYHGADAVFEGQGFFPSLYTKFDDWRTRRDDHIDAHDQVLTLGRYSGRVLANGARVDAPFAHLWTVREGKIVRMRQFTDTAEFAAAMAKSPLATTPE